MDNKGQLTQINEGSSHSQNPLGGVPMGQGNSVEQNETIKDNFVYSNRIMLDKNLVSQFNLPKSLIGKSIADATKLIDKKFEGRNDKISQSTRESMLAKIGQAQESTKPQEPQSQEGSHIMPDGSEMQGQMAYGGFKDSTFGAGFQKDATAEELSGSIGVGIGALTTVADLGSVAFGKASQDITGTSASERASGFGMVGGSALKGAAAGTAIMPGIGTAIGAGVGAIAGGLGLGKARKAEALNTQRFATNTNNQYGDQYAMGGNLNSIDPPTKDGHWQTKPIVKYQPGVTNDKLGSGFYLYSKDNTDPTFNHETDREFVKNSGMMDVQRTTQWQDYMRSQSQQPQTKQMFNGGPIKPPTSIDNIQQPLDILGFQNFVLGQNKNALSKYGADGKWGKEGSNAYQKYGNAYNNSLNQKIDPNIISQIQSVDAANQLKREESQYPAADKSALIARFNPDKALDANTNTNKTSFGDKLGQAARYAPIAMNAYQLSQLKKPQFESLQRLDNRYKPEYVDEAQLQNIADQSMNNSINQISQSGASQGQIRSSILGAQLQRTRGLSDAYGQAAAQNRATNDRGQQFNLGVDQINLQQSNSENDINARNSAAYRNEKSKYLAEIGNSIGDVGKEEVYKDIAKKTTGYKFDGTYVKSPEGNIVTDPDTGKPMTEEKLKSIQSTKTTKKALGGYLINRK